MLESHIVARISSMLDVKHSEVCQQIAVVAHAEAEDFYKHLSGLSQEHRCAEGAQWLLCGRARVQLADIGQARRGHRRRVILRRRPLRIDAARRATRKSFSLTAPAYSQGWDGLVRLLQLLSAGAGLVPPWSHILDAHFDSTAKFDCAAADAHAERAKAAKTTIRIVRLNLQATVLHRKTLSAAIGRCGRIVHVAYDVGRGRARSRRGAR